MPNPIPDSQVQDFHANGYVVIERFFGGAQLRAIQEEIDSLLPGWPEARQLSARLRYHQFPFGNCGSGSRRTVVADELNAATLDPHVVDFVRRCLGSNEILLNDSGLVGKYPRGSYDQPHHQDYTKYSLVVPDSRAGFQQLQIFIYWHDVTADLGPTCILPDQFTEGVDGAVIPHPARPEAVAGRVVSREGCQPDLYDHEVKIIVPAGSLLAYHTGAFHRASAFTGQAGRRVSQHLIWRVADNYWNAGPSRGVSIVERCDEPAVVRFLEMATPEQRALIGFPRPDSDYWCAETVRGVQRRYPNMDMTPYLEGSAAAARAVAADSNS